MRGWAAVAVLAAGCAGGGTGDRDGSRDRESATTVPEVAAATWPTAGRDLANSRAVPGSRLTSETIAGASELWRAPLAEAGALSTAPLVVDGTVYVQGGSGQVVAVDALTGGIDWASEPTGVNIGPIGVAVDAERVYALDGSEGVLALDRRDGAELWSTDVTTSCW